MKIIVGLLFFFTPVNGRKKLFSQMLTANLYLLLRKRYSGWRLNSRFAVRGKVFTLLTFNFTIQLFTADRYPLEETSVVFYPRPFFSRLFLFFSHMHIAPSLHLTFSMPRVFAMRGEARNKRFLGDKIGGSKVSGVTSPPCQSTNFDLFKTVPD